MSPGRVTWGIALSMVTIGAFGALGGCESTIDPPDDPTVTLAFTTPTAGASFVRDMVEPQFGWRAADVAVELAITGAPASIDLSVGDAPVGTADLDGHGHALIHQAGPVTLTATARDAAGEPVATATVDLDVGEPDVASCHAWLDLYGAQYSLGPANQGVADPVTLKTPINGVRWRYIDNTSPRSTFFMDCSLARSLLEAAPYLRERGVVEAADIGVYNYRCIGSTGTPPDCPQGMSQHAYAKAIDIGALITGDGTTYTVETDWVIDPTTEKTCEAATENDKDAWLHQLICALKGGHVWNIVLTPNYNADHRNHFHVDLTPDSDFIRRGGTQLDVGPDDD